MIRKYKYIVITACIIIMTAACLIACDTNEDYKLTYTSSMGGRIDGELIQTVSGGSDGSLVIAVPENGYIFDCWSDGYIYPERKDMNISSSITVQAQFIKIKYQCLYVAEAGGRVIGEAQQWVEIGGDSLAVAAAPDEGYYFEKWSDGVITRERTEINVTENVTVHAIFTQSYSGGEGTLSNPYKISKVSDLMNIVSNPDKHYIFVNDIFLPIVGPGQSNFTPLCSETIPFIGSLDGAGYILANLTLGSGGENIGLFSFIGPTGIVKNLTIPNVLITEPSVSAIKNVGVVAGRSEGIINNIKVSGNIYYGNNLNGSVNIGGIVGTSANKIQNCISDININTSGTIMGKLKRNELSIGGIVGWMSGYEYDIGKCSFDGKICIDSIYESQASGSLYLGVGGIAANTLNELAGTQTPLADSYFTGEVDININCRNIAFFIWVGGITGRGDNINGCSSTGKISLSAFANTLYGYIGGAAGEVCIINDTLSTGDIAIDLVNDEILLNSSHTLFAGGLAGLADYVIGCYSTGGINANFNGIEMGYLFIFIGGLTGTSGSIDDSYSSGTILINIMFLKNGVYGLGIGGLTGVTAEITNCYTSADVTLKADLNSIISGNYISLGGLVGDTYGFIKNCTASGCLSAAISDTGAVHDPEMRYISYLAIGGFIGSATSTILENCTSMAIIIKAEYQGTIYRDDFIGLIRTW